MSDRLHDFARAVVTRQQEQADAVDEETMRAVARDLGMTDEELLQARAEGETRKTRARTLLSQQLVDDAIADLEQAHAFNPLDLEATTMLADALVKRGRKADSAVDLERARSLCRAVLNAAPSNREAAQLLNVIKNNPAGEHRRITPVVVAMVVAAFVIVGSVLLFFLA